MPDPITMTAPAKINLALHVVGRRADGYHLIESLAVFTRDGDTLSARPAETDEIVVAGRYAAQVPIDGANLVVQARDAMRALYGQAAERPVALRLEKNLPVASGIGGGSSDAATTMRLLQRFWNVGEENGALFDLGLTLGADVPMCLAAMPLLARGIGAEIEPVRQFPSLPIVLANPGVPVATASVYGALATPDNPTMPAFAAGHDASAVIDWLAATRNDLEAPAASLAPDIGNALAALRDKGAAMARMSGSGATCFGIFASPEEAGRAATRLAEENPAWFVAATSTGAAEGNA